MEKTLKHKSFYFVSAIIGLILIFFEVTLFRRTIISFKIPIIIILFSAFISFFFIRQRYNKTYQKNSFFFPFMQGLLSFGFASCYCFMALNYYFADNNTEQKSCKILNKHTIGTRNPQPAIEIDYDGIEKQLVFYAGQQTQIDTSTYVLLTKRKGLFGYDVFNDIQLK